LGRDREKEGDEDGIEEYNSRMADDKKKIGGPDRYLIAFKQKWEFNYALKQVQKKAPEGTTRQEAKEALTAAAKKISPSEGRKKIMREALKKLQ
jgi:hypothetical protein